MPTAARRLTSLLLLVAGALLLASSSQRWSGVCPFRGDWNTEACLARQDHAYDVFPGGEGPWSAEPSWAVLQGSAYLALALAVLLVPVALPVATRWWQWAVLVPGAVGLAWMASAMVLSGLVDARGDVSGWATFLAGLVLPVGIALLLVPRTIGVSAGARRHLVVWSLALATPLLSYLLVSSVLIPYGSYDTTPWSEAPVVLPLLVAVLALRPARTGLKTAATEPVPAA